MSFAILRIKKLKSWASVSGSAKHTYRTIVTPNADPTKASMNRTLVGARDKILQETKARVLEVTSKPRTNAVLCIEHLLTASPQFFDGKSEKQIAQWAQSNIDWLKKRYGERNLIHAVLHRDETTPHIVAYIVPEMDGKLNARAVMGNRDVMREMQTDYARAVEAFGLERGVRGSKARHQVVKRFYGRVNEVAAQAANATLKLAEPTPPPVVGILSTKSTREASIEAWKGEEKKRTHKMVTYTAKASLVAKRALEEVHQLKAANSVLSTEIDELKEELSIAYQDLGLSKEDVAALRKADISLVAQRLEYMGEIKPKENPIDLVKRVGGFNYEQAVAWLHAEVGPIMLGALVTKSAIQADPPRPFTTAENAIKQAVKTQVDAIGCDKFRISIVPEKEGSKPYLPGKARGKDSEESFYSKEDLIKMIPWLRYENNQGKHIFITPMDEHAYYLLLDDSRLSKEELEKRGYQPCLVQRTSWEKEQVLFKIPKSIPREAVLELFNKMNKTVGDESITGLRHPMRLAGFRNMKAKHERDGQHPFVQVTMAVNRFCQRCTHLASGIAARVKVELGLSEHNF